VQRSFVEPEMTLSIQDRQPPGLSGELAAEGVYKLVATNKAQMCRQFRRIRRQTPDPAAAESLLEQLVTAGALRIARVEHLAPGRIAVAAVEIGPVLPLAHDPLEVHAACGGKRPGSVRLEVSDVEQPRIRDYNRIPHCSR
jgi:hypothetical protein